MLAFKIETYDTTGKGAEEREDLGVMRWAGRGDAQDGQQNDQDLEGQDVKDAVGLHCPTLLCQFAPDRHGHRPFGRLIHAIL